MRGELICYSVAVLLLAGGFTVACWDTVIEVETRHRKYNQIREGMTQEQVDAVMGRRGKLQPLKMSGQWNEMGGFPYKLRWDDAYVTVDVIFYPGLTRSEPHTVSSIGRQRGTISAVAALWFQRLCLVSLWLFGLWLLRRGLVTPKPQSDAEGTSCP